MKARGWGRRDSAEGRAEEGRSALAARRSRSAPVSSLDGSAPFYLRCVIGRRAAMSRTRSSSSASPVRDASPSATRMHCSTVEWSPSTPNASAACSTPLRERADRARKKRDPVRLARAGGRIAREAWKCAETERGVGDGEEPEPARMAEAEEYAWRHARPTLRIVAHERLVHGLDVRRPGPSVLDLTETSGVPSLHLRFCHPPCPLAVRFSGCSKSSTHPPCEMSITLWGQAR